MKQTGALKAFDGGILRVVISFQTNTPSAYQFGDVADGWAEGWAEGLQNDMSNNDVGKGVVYAYEAYEAK